MARVAGAGRGGCLGPDNSSGDGEELGEGVEEVEEEEVEDVEMRAMVEMVRKRRERGEARGGGRIRRVR